MIQKPQKSAIVIENLVKKYQKTKSGAENEALKSISLNIPKGCIYGLLGPNGAGKSTLINILAGLTVKTSGKIIVEGNDQDDDQRKTRYSIGVVPQEVVLDPFFSVTEALEYHAGYYGIPKNKRKTKELIDALHLTDKANANSRKLSGGMKRRVLIAKALVHSPSILILDEPTAGVDVDLRRDLWKYVRKLNKQGTTILLTTHYLEEAEELCDHIAIINHGKIIVDKKTDELLNVLDNKQLTLHLNEKINSIPKELAKYSIKKDGDYTVTITYKARDVSVEDIFSSLKKEKLTIRDISTQDADLEDIFRHLVGNKNKENEAA